MIVDVRTAAREVRAGGVVAYPTETVFGLGVLAEDPAALERLCELKGRTAEKGMSVLVPGIAALERLASPLPEAARELARSFWPGPLTIVVPAGQGLGHVATGRGVGFRCSPHPIARALLEAVGRPIVSTSCNRSGEPPCRSAEEVLACFGAKLAVCEDPEATGRATRPAEPSTVVACDAAGGLEVLRSGAVPRERLAVLLGASPAVRSAS